MGIKRISFFSVPPASAPAPSQTPGQGVALSQSAGVISLQQAFSELRQNQNQFDVGPSTAPASIHSSHPLLQPAAASVPSQASTVTSTVDPIAGLILSNLNQAQEQVLDASPPPASSSSPSSMPTVCFSPPSSSSPPPAVVNQTILQSQLLSQPGIQAVSQPQGQVQVQGQTQSPPQAFSQPPPQTVSAVIATSVLSTFPPASIPSIPQTMLTSPPPAQTLPLVSSPPSSTLLASEVSSDHPSVSPTSSSTASLSSSVIPTTAIPGPQLAPAAVAFHSTPPSSSSSFAVGLLPVTTNVPSVQPTLVHSQPQTAALPGQTHTHCGECDAR